MLCPIDQSDLQMTDRGGVEIDYCPKCRGVWLDRGELDKIIERSDSGSAQVQHAPPQAAAPPQPYREERPRYDDRRDHHYDDRSHYKHKKKKSPLADIFDF